MEMVVVSFSGMELRGGINCFLGALSLLESGSTSWDFVKCQIFLVIRMILSLWGKNNLKVKDFRAILCKGSW